MQFSFVFSENFYTRPQMLTVFSSDGELVLQFDILTYGTAKSAEMQIVNSSTN